MTPEKTDILIIGAGMSGLCAATDLQKAGHDVLVVDKGRGIGGRMASRRIAQTDSTSAHFDHGAQFMTARSERFKSLLETMVEEGVAKEWYRTKNGEVSQDENAHTRWCGLPSITGIVKYLAKDLKIQNKTRVNSLRQENEKLIATLESGDVIYANAAVLTPPVPQSLALLEAGNIQVLKEVNQELEAISYERCIAVMAVLDSSPDIPEPGIVADVEQPLALVVDNQQKGISKLPAVTIHSTPEFALAHWSEERDVVGKLLLEAAKPYFGSARVVVEYQTHGWLYSRPHKLAEASFAVVNGSPPIVLAGDAFGGSDVSASAGPRVEGAALSGWAVAEHLQVLKSQVDF